MNNFLACKLEIFRANRTEKKKQKKKKTKKKKKKKKQKKKNSTRTGNLKTRCEPWNLIAKRCHQMPFLVFYSLIEQIKKTPMKR